MFNFKNINFFIVLCLLLTIFFSGIIFPLDFFTKRFIETVGIKLSNIDSPFIPNITLKIDEYPDNKKFQEEKFKKDILFVSDEYGFRNFRRAISENKSYDIILNGKSNIFGSYYDQHEMLSEILTQGCACKVYNMHGTPKMHLFNEKKFKSKVVISFFRIDELYNSDFFINIENNFSKATKYDVFYSQLLKTPFLYYLRSKFKQIFLKNNYPKPSYITRNDKIFQESKNKLTKYSSNLIKMNIIHIIIFHPTGQQVLVEKFKNSFDNNSSDMIINLPINNYWLEEDSHWTKYAIKKTSQAILNNLSYKNSFFSESKITNRKKTKDYEDWIKIPENPKKDKYLVNYLLKYF